MLSHAYANAGDFVVSVSVTDRRGATGSNSFTVHVEEPEPDLVSLTVVPSSAVIPVGGTQTFVVTATFSDGSTFTTPPGVKIGLVWTSSSTAVADIDETGLASGIAPGQVTITAAYGDISCATTNTCATLTVGDIVPPTIVTIAPSTGGLWPPNHKMVGLSLSVQATDNTDPAPACSIASVSSNEPVNGLGDGDTAPDWRITGSLTLELRAERGGRGPGRIYTIEVACTDTAGNTARRTTQVLVPHERP
jgi:hypothetical protein